MAYVVAEQVVMVELTIVPFLTAARPCWQSGPGEQQPTRHAPNKLQTKHVIRGIKQQHNAEVFTVVARDERGPRRDGTAPEADGYNP